MAKKIKKEKPKGEISEEFKAKLAQEERVDPRNHDYPVSQEQWDMFFKQGSWAKLDPHNNPAKNADSKGRTIISYPDEE